MTPPDLIAALRSHIARIEGVKLALLFGSRARGTARAESDVDLAVLAPGVDLLALGAELTLALDLQVDVLSLEDPGIPLLEALLRDGVAVHEARPGTAATWRFHVLVDLELDRPWYARQRDAWLRRVAEEGL